MNTGYPLAKQAFGAADIDWEAADKWLYALDAGYTYSAAHDDYTVDIPGASIVASVQLSGLDNTLGVFDASDAVLVNLPAGDTITSLVIVETTTDLLLLYLDTREDGSPISIETNGGDVNVVWSNLANKVWAL